MRILILLALLFSAQLYADELEKAYQKEFAYLVAEKRALQQRLKKLDNSQKRTLRKVRKEIDALQQRYLQTQNRKDQLNNQIADASRDVDFAENDNLLLDTTLIQAKSSLKKLGWQLDEKESQAQQLQRAFTYANNQLNKDSRLQKHAGSFFGQSGEKLTGSIMDVGRIAKYGVSDKESGVLAPAGGGLFKLWDSSTADYAQKIAIGQFPSAIKIFLYDSSDKEIEKQQEKTFEDDIKAGGLVGQVILFIGAVGVLLVLVRSFLLLRSGANLQRISARVSELMAQGEKKQALALCKKYKNSISRVIAATIRNMDKDREHIEDIISESILHESSRIDKFGSFIIVIAAISPLLGLLGTVTGMISTFDIITEFGTGDPKLLSSGISEALVTTKFGLIVAIPMLLLGNMLSSWAQGIKNNLEQVALHMINQHKT